MMMTTLGTALGTALGTVPGPGPVTAVPAAVGGPGWEGVREWTGAVLLLVGVGFTLVAAIGLVRLPDLFQRMHAATKPQLLGLGLVCAGIVVSTWSLHWLVLAVVVLALQVVTAPVGSHLMSRAVYRIEGGGPDGSEEAASSDPSDPAVSR